jgi:hypothetical protein
MSKDVSFAMDTKGAEEILQSMMMPTVKAKADAIAARATSMAGSMSKTPPNISVTTRIGTIKRGVRAIATISAEGRDAHQNYIGHYVLARAKDAGR